MAAESTPQDVAGLDHRDTAVLGQELAWQGEDMEKTAISSFEYGLIIVATQLAWGLAHWSQPCSEPLPLYSCVRFLSGSILRGGIAYVLYNRGKHLEDRKTVLVSIHEAHAHNESLESHGIVVSRNFRHWSVQLGICINVLTMVSGGALLFRTGCGLSAWEGSCGSCGVAFVQVAELLWIIDLIYTLAAYSFFWRGYLVGEGPETEGYSGLRTA